MSSPALTVSTVISEEDTSSKTSSSDYSVLRWGSRPNILPVPHPKREALRDTGPVSVMVDSRQSDPVGLLDPVLSDTRRKKLDMIDRLHNLGTQRDIDLPSIVVIGSQSAGKSSLIESISGISLPRSSGTCTRCPTECRLIRTTSSEPWQCTVFLRFLTDGQGRPLDMVRNIPFGGPINDPKDVEERLRRAQLAILNPSVPPQIILDGKRQLTNNSLSFSSNIICVEIKGPNMMDLSFCDLPGLIASVADGGRDEDVDIVRDLVASYIQKQSCIILLAVACEVDFETQGAYRLAKKYDPEGVRTIGVLTKPDRIPEGEHSRWLKLIRNESSALQNGWFCVRQLSSVELEKALPFEQSRHLCEEFFKKNPWNNLDAHCQKRLGTKAVTIKLNEFLMSVISKRIPEIIEELQDLVQETKEQLQALPTPPSSDPFLGVTQLINGFCDTLYTHSKGFHADGDANSEELAARNHFEAIKEAQKKFQTVVHKTAPKFKPYVRHAKLKEADNHAITSQSGEESGSETEAETMYLDNVSAIATRAVTRELPGYSPFHVVQDLITRYTEKWRTPALNLVTDICHIINEHQTRIIRCHFEKYTTGGLYHAIKNLVNGYTRSRKEHLEKQVNWLLKLESSAFTLNDSLLLKYESDSLGVHQKTRQAYINVDEDKDSSALTVIATVEGYFQVAHKRFVDIVPLAIDHGLVRTDKNALYDFLCKGLKLTSPNTSENCAKFLAESTQTSDLRADLQGRLERLEAAQTELLDI